MATGKRPFELPDFYLPYPARLNPNVAAVWFDFDDCAATDWRETIAPAVFG